MTKTKRRVPLKVLLEEARTDLAAAQEELRKLRNEVRAYTITCDNKDMDIKKLKTAVRSWEITHREDLAEIDFLSTIARDFNDRSIWSKIMFVINGRKI